MHFAWTAQEKHEWFIMIQQAIQEQVENRARWINENIAQLENVHETARASRYCGRYMSPKKHELLRVQAAKSISKQSKSLNPDVKYEMEAFDRLPPCKLCQRPIKKFTRTSKCPWCLDSVCNDCINHKASLPTSTKPIKSMKVCDGCFGTIGYWTAEINHTQPEFSQTDTAQNANVNTNTNSNSNNNNNVASVNSMSPRNFPPTVPQTNNTGSRYKVPLPQ